MKKRSVALIITVMVILSACSTIRFTFNTKINTVRTTILANHLFKKNGNAFYLTTTWSPISVVWTYKGTKMEVFRLWRGSIRNKQSFVVDNITGYIDKGLEDAKEELYHTCPMCLDGDGFDYLILTDSGPYEAGYSLDIGDLKTVSFSSPFLKKLQKDINTFGLWDYWVNQNDNGNTNVKSVIK